MAQNLTIANATYSAVPAIDVPKQGGGTARFTDTSPTTAADADIRYGKIYIKADGSQSTGTATERSSSDLTASGATVTAPAGYYASAASKSVASAVNTESGVEFEFETISGQRMCKMTPWFAYTAGYINTGDYDGVDSQFLNAVPANTTITPSASAQTVGDASYMMEGAVTVAAMPSGSATPPTTISGSQATLTTGTNTITLQKTLSVTPQVSAGYVSAGTAGNVLVNLNANVTTKAATTFHPSSSQQTIASGTYLTGTQTINAVTTTNLTADNIKNGVVVQVGDSSDPDSVTSITGTYSGGGGADWEVDTKTITASNYPVSIQFTSMKGQPKAFFLRSTSQISSSGSTTYYYIIDMRYNGTNTTGNCFRIGSTRRVGNITSGYSWSYSGTTLTVTSSASSRSASPGAFNNGYELTYFY